METFNWRLDLELAGVDGGWTDCTGDVSLRDDPIEIIDGIQSTSLTNLLANPGSISWVFDNSAANSAHLAGYYSPGHANCRAGFAKNIRVMYSEYYNFIRTCQGTYWLQKVIPGAGTYGEDIIHCQATDWLGMMMDIPLPAIGMQINQTGDQLMTTLLEAVIVQPEGSDFDMGDSTYVSALDVDDVQKDSVYSILGKIARSEFGRIYMQPFIISEGNFFLLLENSDHYLLESGDKLILG